MSPDFCASGIWTGVAPGDSSVLQGIDKVIGGIQLVAGLVWRVKDVFPHVLVPWWGWWENWAQQMC